MDFVFGELCLTRLCLNGSVLTVADNPVLVGVVSLEDRLLPPLLPGIVLVTVVVLRLVAIVCFLPL